MDIKKKLKNVEKKILSFDEEFNEEDTFLIFHNEKLLKEYVIALSKDPNIWQRHDVIIEDTIPLDYLEGTELLNVIENITFSYYKKYHSLSFGVIDDAVRTFNCPTGTRNDLARKLTDIILSGEYDLNTDCDTYAMAILIKNNKKDIIASIKNFDNTITEKMLENYYQYCLKNDITPTINLDNLNTNLTLKYLDSFSVESLLRLLVVIYNKESEDIVLKVYNKIIEKINNIEGEIKLDFKIEGLGYQIPIERAHNIFKALYDKDYLVYAPDLVENHKVISENELRAKLKDYVLSRIDLDERVIKRNINYLDDEEIVLHLAKTNQIQFLFYNSLNDFYESNKEEILEELLKNKNLKELLKDCTFNIMHKNHDLTLELANRGLLDTIKIDTRDDYIEKKDIKLLETLMDDYGVKIDPLISNYSRNCNKLLLKLFGNRDYIKELVLAASSYNDTDIAIIKDNLDKIMAYIDQDITALDNFTKNYINLILENTKLQTFYAENDFYLTELILNRVRELEERETYDYSPSFYRKFKDNIVKLYNVKEENLEILYKRFGPNIIKYLENDNIRKLATIEKKDLKKILDLFPDEKLTMSELSSAYISIREYTFSKENPEHAEIRTLLMKAIKEDNQDDIYAIIQMLDKYFDEKLFNMLNDKYKLVENGFDLNNHFKLLVFLTSKAKSSANKEKYENIISIICDYYVACKRAEFADVNKLGDNLKLTYNFDEKELVDQIAKYVIKYEGNRDRMKNILRELMLEGFTKQEILELFSLLRGEKKATDIDPVLFSRIKEFKKAIYDYFKDHGILHLYIQLIENDKKFKLERQYNIDNSITLDPLKILSNIDIDDINSVINGDEKIYESLKDLFTKKKIHLLPTNIIHILQTDNINVSYTEENIAAIISYYPQIYHYEQKKVFERKKKKLVEVTQKLNEYIIRGYESKAAKLKKKKKQLEEELTGEVPAELATMQALLSSETYKAISSVFALVLTPEDARLIKDNPDPQSAKHKTKNNGRLKEAVELTKELFTRKEVTVPTFNKVIKLNDNTSIRVIVGNFTDPCNLTHGERTGACMRIGGIGENLLYNSIKNKNGFHIKFEDAKTGEYLSRVTGFRNGNTVFLNELRESLEELVLTNDQLIEVAKMISDMLIKESKKSSYPIENVIAARNSVLQDYPDTVDIEIGEKGESIGEIYNNINPSACVVLATSSYESFAPIKLGEEDLPTYLPARRTVKEITDKKELSKYVNRVDAVKRILAGEDYKLLTNKFSEQDIVYALANDEWYIYIDSDYQIHSDCIEADERAVKEYQENLKKVDLYIQELCEQKIER